MEAPTIPLVYDESELPLVVGLNAFAEAGKDEVAKVLVAEFGYTIFSFSDALNRALVTLNPWVGVPNNHDLADLLVDAGGFTGWHDAVFRTFYRYADVIKICGYTAAKTIPEVRDLLQVMGTDVGRKQIHPDVWARVGREMIGDVLAAGGRVVITNIRFDNEIGASVEVPYAYGGKGEIWYVRRPGKTRVNDHESEDLAEAFHYGDRIADVEINNDGTLEDLREAVLDAVGVVR